MPVAAGQSKVVSFMRDEDGKLCPDGKYRDKYCVILYCKYDKEIILMLGVAIVVSKKTTLTPLTKILPSEPSLEKAVCRPTKFCV